MSVSPVRPPVTSIEITTDAPPEETTPTMPVFSPLERAKTEVVQRMRDTNSDDWTAADEDPSMTSPTHGQSSSLKSLQASQRSTGRSTSEAGCSITSGASHLSAIGVLSGTRMLPPDLFEAPCLPMTTSGGTAAFYHVEYVSTKRPPGVEPGQYIGKDISRAEGEPEFYTALEEEIAEAKFHDRSEAWIKFAESALQSPGIVSILCRVPGKEGLSKRNLLLMENFSHGFDKLRLCDIKLGEETAVANWKGKSWLSAWSNSLVDASTNSVGEGLRLEGMQEPPESLRQRLLAFTDENNQGGFMRKKFLGEKPAQRYVLQRLKARDFLEHWLDLSESGPGYEVRVHRVVWDTLSLLTKLCRSLASLPFPQQWIGASIGLGLEAGESNSGIVCKLFDWGRAELYNEERYSELSRAQRRACIHHWQQYVAACCRLHWEVARIAVHRCCCSEWAAVVFEVHVESTELIRAAAGAALRGSDGIVKKEQAASNQVLGVAMFNLRDQKGLTADQPLALKLGSSRDDTGSLCVDVSVMEPAADGSVTTSISVRKLWLLGRDAIKDNVVVRVVVFKDVDDAQLHLEARRNGESGHLPVSRACSQSTPPGRKSVDGWSWDVSLDFLALGDKAADMQRRLSDMMPECFEDANSNRIVNDDLWPETVPPPFLSVEEAKAHSSFWSLHFAPWLTGEDAKFPRKWLLSEDFSVAEEIQVFSQTTNAWLNAVVEDVDLVVVQYAGKGGATVKHLPLCHEHLRHEGDTLYPGDPVEIFSSSQNAWLQGRVMEVDLVVVRYTSPEGQLLTKQLPATHDHLRRTAVEIPQLLSPSDRARTEPARMQATGARLQTLDDFLTDTSPREGPLLELPATSSMTIPTNNGPVSLPTRSLLVPMTPECTSETRNGGEAGRKRWFGRR